MSIDLLLDTNMVIWLAAGDERARAVIPTLEDEASTVTISVVSWIEIAIKHSTRKLDLSVDLVRAAAHEHGILELQLQAGHASMLERLPLHHRDPFDRGRAGMERCRYAGAGLRRAAAVAQRLRFSS